MKQLGVSLQAPRMGYQSIAKLPLSISSHFLDYVAVAIYTYSWVERGTVTLTSPKSDQHLFSPFSIIPESNIKVMRIKEMIINWRNS